MHGQLLAGVAALAFAAGAPAQQHDPSMHRHDPSSGDANYQAPGAAPSRDPREPVRFPEELRLHTLANMRDHLLALQQIQESLAAADYDKAAEIAEQRLGMSSLGLHGAHEVAKYMPRGMQDAGTAMHHGASRFAVAAQESSVTADFRPALAALSRVTASCVACHAAYRLE
ncbi:MAG TPA: hypothetical protein DHV08_04660 [Rhodocyclaceae bacterium]|nr:MAG: hypothetical protein AUK49_03135 [Betaproteobacteria bacterium CG2_30_68_42]PIX74160.1 MAG: hypothetical protein COZ38_11465 [Rhodocyclales bacterium CG_4_10_14_3_um_filter_68_10]PJA56247.1 MAG: hypothetical protein CO164_13925 [Rhodocyclales bacterium CG_4_9_14_3_um_filter_68_10]HCX32903.1 hypothetical protein [Rhodocyclaceae bacterium]